MAASLKFVFDAIKMFYSYLRGWKTASNTAKIIQALKLCYFSSIIYFRHNAVVLRVMLKFSSTMYITLSTIAFPPEAQLYVAIKHKINYLGEDT